MSRRGPTLGIMRGICPVCHRSLSVNPSGVMRLHPERQSVRCTGSGMAPMNFNEAMAAAKVAAGLEPTEKYPPPLWIDYLPEEWHRQFWQQQTKRVLDDAVAKAQEVDA